MIDKSMDRAGVIIEVEHALDPKFKQIMEAIIKSRGMQDRINSSARQDTKNINVVEQKTMGDKVDADMRDAADKVNVAAKKEKDTTKIAAEKKAAAAAEKNQAETKARVMLKRRKGKGRNDWSQTWRNCPLQALLKKMHAQKS